nr:universal stress protein [Desulfuromonadales bacterium]
RGIESSIVRSEGKKNVAQGLLDQSNSLGADLLIMGAYGESHERETLFGGNTQSVVDKARMPVLMVH